MNINRPWPSTGIGWLLDVVALIFVVLLICGVHVPYGALTPLALAIVADLV